jgi:hypothetical protein
MALVLSTNTVVGRLSLVEVDPDVPLCEPATVVAFTAHTAVEQRVTAEILPTENLIKILQFIL